MKIAIVCAPGIGDLIIFLIAAHHLKAQGHQVTTISPHDFGKWSSSHTLQKELNGPFDALFLQHDNKPGAFSLRKNHPNVYTFFGTYKKEKHGPLNPEKDYICNLNLNMVDNVILSLKALFRIDATKENGLTPPKGLIHRKHRKKIAIQAQTQVPFRNWPLNRFEKVAKDLSSNGYDPEFLTPFPTLESLFSYLYEVGYFLGNDSGPGHIASCLQIPSLIIGRDYRHLLHWAPGWKRPEVLTPSLKIPNPHLFRLREKYWKHFITTKSVIKTLKSSVLDN